ncbi:hypothetical protein [Bizionia psychrotolerans]|uniref:hypothetical protein n=1 Tax=Bizionia psychrotolerans TaxID=1492901 RepID=UPI000650FAC6|nr:hypothetical protein [Bizionia psychrotolerans]
MKYLVLTLFVFLSGITNNPPAKNKLKLAKHYKVEQTFSGNTANNSTFHLILANNKESKLFEIIPLTFANGEIKQLASLEFNDTPEILSYHNNNNVLSIITSSEEDKDKVIIVNDLNIETGIVTKSESYSFEDYKSVIQKGNSSILLFANSDSFKAVTVSNAADFKETTVKKQADNKDFLKALSKEKLDAINTDEFVANGSIGNLRAYSNEEVLFITEENEKENITTVSTLNLNQQESSDFQVNEFKSNEDFKNSTSYVSNNKLVKLSLDKKSGSIDVYNLDDSSQTNLNLNSLKPTKKSAGFESMESFLKSANKSSNAPTITANKTKNGAMVLRADYVDKERYQYNNFWFHHWFMHNQMMMQQRQMMARPGGFGPNPNSSEEVYSLKDKSHYFEIVLSTSGDILNEDVDVLHKDYNKEEHLETLKDNKNLDHISATFITNDMVYLAYNKKSKEFVVYNKTVLK